MEEALDTDAGVQEFEIGRRIRDDDGGNPGRGRRYWHAIGAGKVRKSRGMKLRLGRRVGLDKMFECERLAIALRSAGMFATSMRGGVGSETEQKLRARQAVTPKQGSQQQQSQERIGNGPHRNCSIA